MQGKKPEKEEKKGRKKKNQNQNQISVFCFWYFLAFLTAAMEYEQQDVWIGLSNGQSNPDFTWTDGSSLNYTNWGREQPDGYPGSTGTNPPVC